jgi:hypothetical protein
MFAGRIENNIKTSKNPRKMGKNMSFDTRGSMPVTCPFTCSKIKEVHLVCASFILA